MSLERFKKKVDYIYDNNKRWRKGQALFNILYIEYPDFADEIRGTIFDPFYDNNAIDKCYMKMEKDKII